MHLRHAADQLPRGDVGLRQRRHGVTYINANISKLTQTLKYRRTEAGQDLANREQAAAGAL